MRRGRADPPSTTPKHKMTRAAAKRWITHAIAVEIRVRLSEVPDYINNAPDPEMIESMWTGVGWDIADHIWPENKILR